MSDGAAASGGGSRSRLPLYVAAALLLVLLAGLAIARPWEEQAATAPETGETTAPVEPAAQTVEVRSEDYVGEPVDEVESDLGDLGLETTTEQRANPGTEQAGTVAELDPTGEVELGTTITLQVWGDPPAEEPAPEPVPDEDASEEADKAEERAQKEAEKAAEEARKEAEKAAERSGEKPGGQGNSGKGNGNSDD